MNSQKTLTQILEGICALQPKYSSSNTKEMEERGKLVRADLGQALKERIPKLQGAFDPRTEDLSVESSDGIGRKTEAPWCRLFSKALSPNPRTGFYLVIHFAANGSAVFITVGCGSTVWANGDLRPISDQELETRTSWARSVVIQRWGSISPFEANMALGAKAALPKTFEKATALALRIPTSDLSTTDLDSKLYLAAERLGEIYRAQLDQRDIPPGEQDLASIKEIFSPLKSQAKGQGMGLTQPERRAIELQAMKLATEYLIQHGYKCTDTSASHAFDLHACKNGEELKVEVKGTTADICSSILMTKNEVRLHQDEKGKTALIMVYSISLKKDSGVPSASGGKLEALIPWDIDEWTAEPIAFQLRRN